MEHRKDKSELIESGPNIEPHVIPCRVADNFEDLKEWKTGLVVDMF